MKPDLVSKIRHELHTPIVAMQQALGLLSDGVVGPLTEEQQRFVALTQRNLLRLAGLVHELCELSQLESKGLRLLQEPTPVDALTRAVCASLASLAQPKAVTLTSEVPADLPRIICDPSRITDALTHLLRFAIQWSPQRSEIRLEGTVVEAEHDRAITVRITVPGLVIPEDALSTLFTQVQQAEEPSADPGGALGFGLAIAKQVVELHRGRIWAERAPTQTGTSLSILLPITPLQVRGDRRP